MKITKFTNDYLSTKGLEDKKLMDEILQKGRNTEQITSNVLKKSMEYLENYYNFFIDFEYKKQLIAMDILNPLEVITIDQMGNISFKSEKNLKINTLTFMKIINTCFIFNRSYFPSIFHNLDNNFFAGILTRNIDPSKGYINFLNHGHSHEY